MFFDDEANQDWVYLLGSGESDGIATDVEETLNKAIAAESDLEENVPDIMEIGDLEIDDDVDLDEDHVGDAFVSAGNADEPETEGEDPKEPDLMAVAASCLRNSDSERNAAGHVRASVLRDELLTHPAFCSALKESGLKPISFIGQLFPNHIRI